MSCGVVERVLNWARAKSQAQISKKQSGSKHSKLRGIPKLDDANEAGGMCMVSNFCVIFLLVPVAFFWNDFCLSYLCEMVLGIGTLWHVQYL